MKAGSPLKFRPICLTVAPFSVFPDSKAQNLMLFYQQELFQQVPCYAVSAVSALDTLDSPILNTGKIELWMSLVEQAEL